jgi:stage II sporulation protein P
MKRITVVSHSPRTVEALCTLLAGWRAFVALSVFTFAAVVAAGLAGLAFRASTEDWPAGGAAASLPDGVLAQMAGMELPSFRSAEREGGIDGRRAASFLFRFLTGINPHQPRSLLASELPGLESSRAVLLRPGSVGEHVTAPADHPPLPEAEDGGEGAGGKSGTPDVAPRHPSGSDADGGPGRGHASAGMGDSGTDAGQGGTGKGNAAGGGKEAAADGEKDAQDSPETPKRKSVLIYHSHNRESWLPELGEGAKNAESDEINITLVGKRLAQRLEEAGVGAVHADVDYVTAVEDYRWELSYKYSKETVIEAMAEHDGLTWLLDIHRDSQPRGYTTATIDGKDYAQVYFVIGKGNPDWRKNEAFAAEIHRLLEERYPGISRGIWGKDASSGNGEYNQSLSPNSVLIEVGGIENTLEECYRTADALAEVIAELYRSAVETGAEPN